jgi:hypothetical protein
VLLNRLGALGLLLFEARAIAFDDLRFGLAFLDVRACRRFAKCFFRLVAFRELESTLAIGTFVLCANFPAIVRSEIFGAQHFRWSFFLFVTNALCFRLRALRIFFNPLSQRLGIASRARGLAQRPTRLFDVRLTCARQWIEAVFFARHDCRILLFFVKLRSCRLRVRAALRITWGQMSKGIRARIREPGESLRWFFYGLAAICIGAGVIFRIEIGPPLDPVFFIGAALLLMSPIFERRAAWRSVEIDARPGNLRISGRGLFGKKENVIALTNVTGASTARVDGEVSLALALGSRSRHPVAIRFENEADAKLTLDALGIGRTGFGILVWDRGPRFIHLLAAAVRVAATLYCFVVFVAALVSDPFAATLDVRSLSTLIIVGAAAFVTLMPLVIARRSLSLLPSGIHTFEERARFFKYADVSSFEAKTSHFAIAYLPANVTQAQNIFVPFVKRTWLLPGLDDTDIAIIAQQVESAAARARNAVPVEAAPSNSLLERRKDEALATWIARIDELADSWHANAPRQGEDIEARHQLWQIVEDNDQDGMLRVMAARFLSRLDPSVAPPRIRVVAEAIRDPFVARRLRAATLPEAEPMLHAIRRIK